MVEQKLDPYAESMAHDPEAQKLEKELED